MYLDDVFPGSVLVFHLDGQRFALPMEVVHRVVRAVAITPLPGAPRLALGVINFGGVIVPVMNLRGRLGLPEREMELSDQFILATCDRRTVALLVDGVDGLTELPPAALVRSEEVVAGADFIHGLVRLRGGLALVQNLEKLLSPDEGRRLEEALSTRERNDFTEASLPAQ